MQAVDLRSAVRFGCSFQRLSAGLFATATAVVLALVVATPAAAKTKHHRKPLHAMLKLRHAQVTPLSFAALNGWGEDDQAAAFKSFLHSCDAIRHATPRLLRRAQPVYRGLYKVCQRALAAGTLDREAARKFFEDNFKPVRIARAGESQGF
jgi:membrane-bound lytic murein transglycosylase A